MYWWEGLLIAERHISFGKSDIVSDLIKNSESSFTVISTDSTSISSNLDTNSLSSSLLIILRTSFYL